MQYREFPSNTIIGRGGDISKHLFLVLEGRASADLFGIDGHYAQLAGYGPGEIFGAYPAPTQYRADIMAKQTLCILSVETENLLRLAQKHNGIAQGIARIMARQLDILLDRMAARIGLSAAGRCYNILLQLADANGEITPAPVISALAIGVNTSRETASRAFATLHRRGIIEKIDGGLRIVSRRMLEEMVV